MNEDDVRRIVNAELDDREAKRKEAAEIGTSLFTTNVEFQAEKLIDDMGLPDDAKEKLREYMKAVLG